MDLYFKHNDGSDTYKEMGDTGNDVYINMTVYTHDSQETGPVTGYKPVDPNTPGISGSIQPMEGFFIKIIQNQTDDQANHIAYPQMTK